MATAEVGQFKRASVSTRTRSQKPASQTYLWIVMAQASVPNAVATAGGTATAKLQGRSHWLAEYEYSDGDWEYSATWTW